MTSLSPATDLFSAKHPENNLPYYPSTEQWTWLMSVLPLEPDNRYRAEGGLPIHQMALLKQLRQRKLQFGLVALNKNSIGPIGPILHTTHVPPSLRATGEAQALRKGTLVVRPPFPIQNTSLWTTFLQKPYILMLTLPSTFYEQKPGTTA